MPPYRYIYKFNYNAVNKTLLKALSGTSSFGEICFMRYHLASSSQCIITNTGNDQRCYRFHGNKLTSTPITNFKVQRHFSISSVNFNIGTDGAYFSGDSVSEDIDSLSKVNESGLTTFENEEVPVQLVDASFSSVGLGGWSPPGLVQSGMEYLHVTGGLPWWGCVVCGTVIIRLAVLPLVIKFQKNIITMNNALPELQELQYKIMQARNSGNLVDAARYTSQMTELIRTKDINPLKSLIIPLIQMPFFLSFFFGLRGMSETPVESLHHGGMSWFADLTVPDPYYILPVVTCATLLITVELGLDTGVSVNQVQVKAVKYVMRAMPFLMFPILINFPGIILVYWLSTNVISLVQMNVLRIPAVRDYLGFENSVKPAINIKPFHTNPGFSEGFKESLTNLKISHELMEREELEKEQSKQQKEREIFELENRLRKLKDDLAPKRK